VQNNTIREQHSLELKQSKDKFHNVALPCIFSNYLPKKYFNSMHMCVVFEPSSDK